jgi:asparagine synthase (glutamine-hydrolysing)
VPLSGGRDSRHILFELCATGRRPKFCATARYFPPADTEGETKIAYEIARAVGARHVVIDQPEQQWEAERRSNAETDFCSSDAAWTLALADYMKGKIRWVYDGIGGDVLSAGLFLTDRRVALFGSRRLPELAEDLFDAEPDPEMFTPSVRKALAREVAVDRCVAELERHLDAPNPLGSFIFWNRTRRKIAMHSYRVLARAGEVFAPYIDHDVFDLLSGLPAQMFLDHTFHTAAIARGYPEYAGIPYSTQQPGGASRHPEIRQFAMALIRHGVRHGPSELVQRSYFVPRLMRCIVDPRYGCSVRWLGQFMLYLLQLEEARRHAASPSAYVAQVGELHVKTRVRSP